MFVDLYIYELLSQHQTQSTIISMEISWKFIFDLRKLSEVILKWKLFLKLQFNYDHATIFAVFNFDIILDKWKIQIYSLFEDKNSVFLT